MSFSQSSFQHRVCNFSGGGNGPDGPPGFEKTPYTAGDADLTSSGFTAGRSRSGDVPMQDPFTYYKAFMSSGASTDSGRAKTNFPHNDGNARNKEGAEGQLMQRVGVQRQYRQHVAPYHLAIRFANRSNGVPLATIVEQHSVSTINSRNSRPSICRFSSIRSADGKNRGSAGARSPDMSNEKALNGIREETRQEFDTHAAISVSGMEVQQPRGAVRPSHEGPGFPHSASSGTGGTDSSETHESEHSTNIVGLKTFLRDAMHNLRGGQHVRPRSLSVVDASKSPFSGDRPGRAQAGPQVLDLVENGENTPPGGQGHPISATARGSRSIAVLRSQPSSETRTRNRKTDDSCAGYPAGFHPLTPPLDSGSASSVGLFFPQLPLHDESQLEHAVEPALPRPYSTQIPRDVAQGHVFDDATTFFPRTRDKLSAPDIVGVAPTNRNDAHSLRDQDRTRDTSRNASFCSTISTSYSGTVLGVDLDLEYENPSARRSVTPVWFSPKEYMCPSSQTQKRQQSEEKPPPTRFMTSSALSALLPIAVAENIVQTNPTTLEISFFSPSGSLIQAESSSPPSTDSPGSPAIAKSFYSHTEALTAYDALSAAANRAPPKLALVPMTTPPQSFAPLPEHLRHLHNYRHAERSQITPEPIDASVATISSISNVEGCGGVVQSHDLASRSKTHLSRMRKKRRAPTARGMSCAFLGAYRFSIMTKSTPKKGKKLHKRVHPSTAGDGIGKAAGHAMRICFCQPYDGAGQKYAALGCHSNDNQCHDELSLRQTRDTETPNVRTIRTVKQRGEEINLRTREQGQRSDSGASINIRQK